MASWLCHLLTALRVADLFSGEDERDTVYLGSLAPDWTGLTRAVHRRDSHFKTAVPGQYLVDSFVGDYCLGFEDRLVRAFRWGYAGHLMVDRLWARTRLRAPGRGGPGPPPTRPAAGAGARCGRGAGPRRGDGAGARKGRDPLPGPLAGESTDLPGPGESP